MNIIEEVRREREDLARVLKKHAGIRRIVEDLYPDSAHFIYELLQNAEDADATEAMFELSDGFLIFEHNGRPFSKEDIFAITDIGEGTKAGVEDKIGRFGVGFKSVFAYTESPSIWSPTYSFEINDLVLPNEIPSVDNIKKNTRFKFPFNCPQGKKSAADAFSEIGSCLKEIGETTLLFLKNLNSIKWVISRETQFEITREIHKDNHIEIKKKSNDDVISSSHFLKFDQLVDGLEKQHVAVAYELDYLPNVKKFNPRKKLAEQLKIIPANPGYVSVFFPAKAERSGLRYHIHAPFVPELSRASIKETPANQPLYQQIAILSAESLHEIRNLGLLTVEFLSVLPNPQDAIPSRYQIVRTSIVSEMNSKPLTPTHDKSHAPAKQLLQAKASLKELLSADDLEFLIDYEEDPFKWVMSASLKNSNSDRFLSGLEITDWDISEFVDLLNNKTSKEETSCKPYSISNDDVLQWLSAKTIDWHQHLYLLLYKELEPENEIDRLENSRIVRLSSGTYCVGAECFFQGDGIDNELFPMVDPEIYTTGKNKSQLENVRKFLSSLGVREVGEAEQIEALLKKRYQKDHFNPEIKDIIRFVGLVESQPEKSRIFRKFFIFKRQDDKWGLPSQVYLDHPYIDTGLSVYHQALGENHNCKALSAEYEKIGIDLARIAKFAKSVGAAHLLEIKKVSCKKNPNYRYLVLQAPGRKTYHEHDEDYYIDSIEKVIGNNSVSLSRLIWNCISSFPYRWSIAKYCTNYSQPYRKAPSQLAAILTDSAWIPQEGGEFVRPGDASVKMLPKGFPVDRGWEWLKDIGFGENEARAEQEAYSLTEAAKQRDELAKNLGFSDEEGLKRAQRFASLSPEEQENILIDLENRKSHAFPEHESVNPERRARKVAEEAGAAPEKQSEIRDRSVAVGSEILKQEAAQYLREQYTNDGLLYCQICQAPMPFSLDDGTPYFEKVTFISTVKKMHYRNNLALCPNHAAMFKYANSSKDELKNLLQNSESNEISVVLAKKEHKIYFTKLHIADIKEILRAELSQTNGDCINTEKTLDNNNDVRVRYIKLQDQQHAPLLSSKLTAAKPVSTFTNKQGHEVKVLAVSPGGGVSTLKTCPYCKAQISHKNYDRHITKKCPMRSKMTLPSTAISRLTSPAYGVKTHSTINRCRDCNRPAIPGSDRCYSCGG